VEYKEHIRSEQHLTSVNNDPIYHMIDNIIDELNLDAELNALGKSEKLKGHLNKQPHAVKL
jgi:hypothetical protein